MKRYKAFIGDLHGSIEALNSVLQKVDFDTTEVYFLGDYVDRGEHSFAVLKECMQLDKEGKAKFILGNHDAMLLYFVDTGDAFFYTNDPMLNTFKSFCPDMKMSFTDTCDIVESYKSVKEDIRDRLKKEEVIEWLRTLPLHIELDNQILVHAGLDKDLDDWKDTTDEHKLWNRPNFKLKNNTGKTIIMGHTITSNLTGEPLGKEFKQPTIAQKDTEIFIDCANFMFDNARILLYDTYENTYKQV